MKIVMFLCAVIIAGITATAQARPVSYPGGWTAMVMNNGDRNSAHIHYSPTADLSVGYKYERWDEKNYDIHAVQMNNLLKRWNNKHSQANLYLKSGIGVGLVRGEGAADDTGLAAYTGLATDWEDRRFFVSYENRFTKVEGIDDFFQQSARAGVAPYIGDYGDLHTWLMVEVEHSPEAKDKYTVTPLVRLFKGVHLVEAGFSTHGDVLFNYVYRY